MAWLRGVWGAGPGLVDKGEGFQGQAPLVYQLLFLRIFWLQRCLLTVLASLVVPEVGKDVERGSA